MTPHYADDTVTVYAGDCLDVLAELPDASVDAVVTDPPYGLEFMGKEWDRFDGGQQKRWAGRKEDGERMDRDALGADTLGERLAARPSFGKDSRGRRCSKCGHYKFSGTPCVCAQPEWEIRTGTPPHMAAFGAWCQQWATECLRILKPGGHLLAFGGTRTWHRLTCAVEDAGFEIRDSIAWQHQKHIFCQCSPVPYSHDDVSREGVPGVREDLAANDAVPGSAESDLFENLRGGPNRQGERKASTGAPETDDGELRSVRQSVRDTYLPTVEGDGSDVLAGVQRPAPGDRVGDTRPQGPSGVDRRERGVVPGEDDRPTESGVEGRGDVLPEEGQLSGREVRSSARVGEADGAQGRVHHGAPSDHGADGRSAAESTGGRPPHRPQPSEQRPEQSGALAVEWVPQGGGAWPGCPRCRKPLAPPFDGGHLTWNYGSGFPKSLDVSKAIDKAAGAEREVVGRRSDGRYAYEFNGTANRPTGAAAGSDDAERIGGFVTDKALVTAPATDDARRWQGWGTALKPAHEPIVVARKPLTGTVAANVLQHGTGAVNVDGCRIGSEQRTNHAGGTSSINRVSRVEQGYRPTVGDWPPNEASTVAGRWPANVVLDEHQAAALDQQSGELTGKVGMTQHGSGTNAVYGTYARSDQSFITDGMTDRGGASRFFYTAKASSDERITANGVSHPTVKSLDLMRWLVRLVTPPGGIVLDPFAGSGTTAEACILERFRCIAIEREADYLPLITQRINRRRDPAAYVKASGEDGGLFDLLDGETT